MEKNKIYEGTIVDYDANGYGITRLNDKVIFVKNAMKDEKLEYIITQDKKKYAFGEVTRVISPSKNRIKEECPYSSKCGGCDLWHMNYAEEIKVKENKVKISLRNVDGSNTIYNPLLTTNQIYGYRNKVMLPYAVEDDTIISGFYEKASHKVVGIDKCLISSDIANKICHIVTRYLNIFHVSIYEEINHTGIFRELMIRQTALNEIMVIFVLRKKYDLSNLIKLLVDEIKEIKSIYYNINQENTNVVLGNEYILAYGAKTVTEDILGLKFEVSAGSFMQVNHDACCLLYSEALRLAKLTPSMNVIDAYCGMGSITLNIAKHVNHVYGIEVVKDAIDNANNNMKLNNITNATFICGKCEDEITKLANLNNIDVVFVDPPRKGCEKSFLDTIVNMKIPKIIYISCKISSLARDIVYLKGFGYELKEVTGTDLFLRTSHIETIALLELK